MTFRFGLVSCLMQLCEMMLVVSKLYPSSQFFPCCNTPLTITRLSSNSYLNLLIALVVFVLVLISLSPDRGETIGKTGLDSGRNGWGWLGPKGIFRTNWVALCRRFAAFVSTFFIFFTEFLELSFQKHNIPHPRQNRFKWK